MKKYIILLLTGTVLMFSCKKETAPDASPLVGDPFIRMDNPNNAVDHAIFELYQQSGVPVLYSDTLVKNPLTMLNVAYHITSFDSTLRIKFLKKSDDILYGLNFVKTQVLPSLGGSLKPYSLLLADTTTGTVVATINGVRTIVNMLYNAYPGLNTLVVSKVSAISKMAPDTLAFYRKDIFKSILQIPLFQTPALLKDFNAVSAAFYNKSAYGDGSITGYIAYKPREAYGFVSLTPTPAGFYSTGSQADDLNGYLDVVLSRTRAQFATQYGSYPLVMSKYDLLAKVLVSLGFTMP